MSFDWKAAVSDVADIIAQPAIQKADTAAQKNIVLAFILGVGGALLSVLLCTFLAYLIYRGRSRLRVVLDYLLTT
jgi:ABC-type Fe3+ transport system permease subunit